ncbi:MAG: hypothetical protein R3C44_11455 [Chloroflexota bacterium]
MLEVFGQDETRIANNTPPIMDVGCTRLRCGHPARSLPIVSPFVSTNRRKRQSWPRVCALAEGNPGIEVGTIKIVPGTLAATAETTLAEIGDHIAIAATILDPEVANPSEVPDHPCSVVCSPWPP